MKNIIPFKKEVIFKTNLSEVVSISLEHTLSIEDNNRVLGEFIVSGDYRISDKSLTVTPFELKIPFEISVDERYILDKAVIDIDDFYYEIKNNNVLSISIDVLLDKLEEQPLLQLDELIPPVRDKIEKLDEEEIREEIPIMEKEQDNVVDEKINSIFNQISMDNETFVTYNVFILRQGDSLDTIMDKYNVTEDVLKQYNDLSELKIGDKVIIPITYERN